MEFRGPGLRPSIRFTDTSHPLTRIQKEGVSRDTWRGWLSDAFHQRDPEPASAPFQGSLLKHGWNVQNPQEFGRQPIAFDARPAIGDTVKAIFKVLVADEKGDPTTITAGWWIRLDDVSRTDLWTGSLASPARVPSTLAFGSRIWLRPDQVVQHMPKEQEPDSPS